MDTEIKKILRKIYDINRNKLFSDKEKRIKVNKVLFGKSFIREEIRNVAAAEAVNKEYDRLYRIYCQCVGLTGKF